MIDDLVYDVGMNNGDDTAYYLHRGYRVVAIEANPKMVEFARRRFARQIDQRRLVILNVGIAEESTELPFWICDSRLVWSSFDRGIASRFASKHHAIQVKCRDFRSVLQEHGVPAYLKIDIEGNDHLCVHALSEDDCPKYVSVEALDISLLNLLRDHGYASFKWISQHNLHPLERSYRVDPRDERIQQLLWNRRLFVRGIKALGLLWWLRRQMDQIRTRGGWTFPPGSSGPWGEDLPGQWQTFPEMVETFDYFGQLHRRGERSSYWNGTEKLIWADFHARRDE